MVVSLLVEDCSFLSVLSEIMVKNKRKTPKVGNGRYLRAVKKQPGLL